MSADVPEGAVSAGYAELLEQLRARVRSTQVRATRAANTEVLRLYWSIGRDIVDRQDQAGRGTGIVEQLAAALLLEFPGQRGWSHRNLLYMRAFATAWPDLAEFVPQPGAQLPCRHITTLLHRLDDQLEPDWYAARAGAQGWSRAVLEFQVRSGMRPGRGSPVELHRPAPAGGLRPWRGSWCGTRRCSTPSGWPRRSRNATSSRP